SSRAAKSELRALPASPPRRRPLALDSSRHPLSGLFGGSAACGTLPLPLKGVIPKPRAFTSGARDLPRTGLALRIKPHHYRLFSKPFPELVPPMFARQRKGQREGCAGARAIRGREPSAVLLDDLARHRQSEPRTARPRAESRLEDFFRRFGLNSRSGVADRDDCARSLSQGNPLSRNLHPASARHGAQRIQHQVQQHLLEAMPVGGEPHSVQPVAQAQLHPGLPRHGTRNPPAQSSRAPKSMGARSGAGRLWKCRTLFTVAARVRSPACTCSTHPVHSAESPAPASNPANNSRLPRGLRTSCASTAAISARACSRRNFSRSCSRRLPSLTSRKMKIEAQPRPGA